VKVCGVAEPWRCSGGIAGLLLRPATISEHGNRPGSRHGPRHQRGSPGWVHRRPIGSGRGGAAVVVRGRESRPHGEGRQQDSSRRELQCPKTPQRMPRHRRRGYGRCRPSCTAGRSSQQRHESCGEPDAEMIKSHVRFGERVWGNGAGGQPGHRAPGRLQIAGFELPCVGAGLRESRRAAHPDEGARVRRLSRICRRSASLRDLSLARSGLAARETGSAVGGR